MKYGSLSALTLFAAVFTACGDEASTPCTNTSQCAADEVCDLTQGICVSTSGGACTSNDECNTGEVCNTDTGMCVAGGGQCTGSLDCGLGEVCDTDQSICVLRCDDTSMTTDPLIKLQCDATEVCAPETGTCVEACSPPGQLNEAPCEPGEVCMPGGLCQIACDNPVDCLTQDPPQLCGTDVDNANFNMCDTPQDVTGECANATNHTPDAGGPVILAIAYQGDVESCGATATAQQFSADVFVPNPNGLPSALFTEGVRFLRPTGEEGNTYNAPTAVEVGGMPNFFLVTFALCLEDDGMQQLAAFINDADGNASNAACFVAN